METNVNTIQSGKYVVAYQYRYNDFVSGFQMYKTFDYADKGVVKFNDVDEARDFYLSIARKIEFAFMNVEDISLTRLNLPTVGIFIKRPDGAFGNVIFCSEQDYIEQKFEQQIFANPCDFTIYTGGGRARFAIEANGKNTFKGIRTERLLWKLSPNKIKKGNLNKETLDYLKENSLALNEIIATIIISGMSGEFHARKTERQSGK